MVKGAIGAVLGGILGAAIWTAVSYFMHAEVGWIAWGVGALVGGGAVLFAGKDEGGLPVGVMAAVVAAASVAGGKYADVYLTYSKLMAALPAATAESAKVALADEVVEEFEGAGKTLTWPEGMSVDEATEPHEYPEDVWKETEARWAALGEQEQQAKIKELDEFQATMMKDMKGDLVMAGFKASFSGFDLLWFGLALVTAFQIGSGGAVTRSEE